MLIKPFCGYRDRDIPVEVRQLMAAHLCHSEACQGGLRGFLASAAGALAEGAVVRLRAMRRARAAKVLWKAIAHVGTPYPLDLSLRRARLRGLRSDWQELDDQFSSLLSGYHRAANEYAGRLSRAHGPFDSGDQLTPFQRACA